jgi:hypothetical protein
MTTSEQPRSTPKSMHKQHDPSRKARLAYFDQDEATVVRVVLGENPDFRAKARRVAEFPPAQRQAAAEREAASYAPYKAAKWRVIAELLLLMAEELSRSRDPNAALFSFANFHRTAVWEDDESLDDLGARRVRERWESLHEGARSLAWFGAGRCIGCGADFGTERYERGAWDRRSRRKQCERCRDSDPRGGLRRSREANMRQAFDVLTGARQRSRASRRAAS